MCYRYEHNVLRKRGYGSLNNLIWNEIYIEIEKHCPTTMQSLITLVNGRLYHVNDRKVPHICLLHAIPMFIRVPELFKLQRLNTGLFSDGGASKMVG